MEVRFMAHGLACTMISYTITLTLQSQQISVRYWVSCSHADSGTPKLERSFPDIHPLVIWEFIARYNARFFLGLLFQDALQRPGRSIVIKTGLVSFWTETCFHLQSDFMPATRQSPSPWPERYRPATRKC